MQGALTKSFSSAAATAQRYPAYTNQIVDGARKAFLQGDRWAYTAGVVAVLIGAALMWFFLPRKDAERRLLASYRDVDTAAPNATGGGQTRDSPPP